MWKCENCKKANNDDRRDCWNCSIPKGMVLAEGVTTKKQDELQRIKDIWQKKSDEELLIASQQLINYRKEAEEVIRAELRRRNFPEPEPTIRVIVDEQNSQLTNSSTISFDPKILIAIGIVIAIFGIGLIIMSPSMVFVERGQPSQFDPWGMDHRIKDLTNVTKFSGVVVLIIGGIISAVGFSQLNSTQQLITSESKNYPVVTKPISPKSVGLGNTPDEVQSVMGNPDKIINLETQVIHIYSDMKIIYVDGKVSDVKIS